MRPTIALTALLLTLPLAGCDLLDRLEGKSPGREWVEARQSMLLPAPAAPAAAPAVTASTPAVVAATPVVVAPEPVPVVVPAAPAAPAVCVAIFRVLSCGDAGEFIWL